MSATARSDLVLPVGRGPPAALALPARSSGSLESRSAAGQLRRRVCEKEDQVLGTFSAAEVSRWLKSRVRRTRCS
jgi:hypothetical protein